MKLISIYFCIINIVLLICLNKYCSSYKILILSPFGSKSEYMLVTAVGEALASGGHKVTILNSYSNSSRDARITDIYTGLTNRSILDKTNAFKLQNTFDIVKNFETIMNEIGESMWTNDEVWTLFDKRKEFDAIIIQGHGSEIASPFLIDFPGPVITLCTPGVEILHLTLLGNWVPFSVVPTIFLPYDEYMSFFERAVNPICFYLYYRLYYWITFPKMETLLKKFFPNIGPYDQLLFRSNFLFINSHFALDSPIPLLPNQIEIGTINAKEPKPLPKDISEFIEGAENGLIYMSLGTVVKSKHMLPQHKKTLVNVFNKLPQRVLWKYEGNVSKLDLSTNVLTKKWLPQQDILGHSKTLLFISHCGTSGTQEAKYHGVPTLAMPVIYDQHRNAIRLVKQGFGLQLNWEELTEESLKQKISNLIYDKNYREKLENVSRILHDQKESPAERVRWWTEYVIRHDGAHHMYYPGQRLHYLQYVSFDVFLFWAFIIGSNCYAFFWLIVTIHIKKTKSTKTKNE